MVPTGSDESKLRTFQGPFQDQMSHYKDFYVEFHDADIPNTPHICGNQGVQFMRMMRPRDGGRKLIGGAEMVPLNPFH